MALKARLGSLSREKLHHSVDRKYLRVPIGVSVYFLYRVMFEYLCRMYEFLLVDGSVGDVFPKRLVD